MCDICVLYLLKKKYFYRNKKYQYVDDPDANTSEDEASFRVRFFCLKTRLLLAFVQSKINANPGLKSNLLF